MGLSIGKLAKATEVKVPTIRFYEQIGLLPAADRTESDQRIYAEPAIRRLAFIKHARQLGFPIDAIRSLLDLSDHPEKPCDGATILAEEQLAGVERKITQLESLRTELKRMVAAACNGSASECRVIEALANHTLCGTDRPAPTGNG